MKNNNRNDDKQANQQPQQKRNSFNKLTNKHLVACKKRMVLMNQHRAERPYKQQLCEKNKNKTETKLMQKGADPTRISKKY